MGVGEAAAIFAAGVGAGTVNAAVGSGTLITFPVLLGLGFSPVAANVSNTIGLVPGSLAGAASYARDLRQDMTRIARFAIPSVIGGTVGAALLLFLPAAVFSNVVPIFISLALLLVICGPRLRRVTETWHGRRSHTVGTLAALFVAGIYGGYFGAAQGVIVLAILGITAATEIGHLNGTKNVLVMLVNLVAGIAFSVEADVAWTVAGLIASGSILGGFLGASLAKRMPSPLFRGAILLVGTAALVKVV